MEDKHISLKDGRQVLLREMSRDDVERSFAFFQELPGEERVFLRVDVTKRSLVERRIKDMEEGGVRRIVALDRERIVADAALELAEHGWKEHVGELRLIVAAGYRRNGLGAILARELFHMAVAEGLEEVVVRIMRPQTAPQRLLQSLGFADERILPGYVKDQSGTLQDMILMRRRVWEEI